MWRRTKQVENNDTGTTQVLKQQPLTLKKWLTRAVSLVTVGTLKVQVGPALADVGSTLSETEIHDVIINGTGGMPGDLLKVKTQKLSQNGLLRKNKFYD